MKKMTEAEIRAAAQAEEFDESFLEDPELPVKMSNDDLPAGVHLAEQVAVTVFSTPNGPRIYLSGTVEDPDRVSFLLNAAHHISLQNAVDFYLGVDPDEEEEADEDAQARLEKNPHVISKIQQAEKDLKEAPPISVSYDDLTENYYDNPPVPGNAPTYDGLSSPEEAADKAGHMVVSDGYVGGGAMTAGDIT